MKKYLLMAITASLAAPAWAAHVSHPKCDEIVNIDDKFTPQYLAVVDGYDHSGKKLGESVDVGGIVTESSKVKQECAKRKTAALESVRKTVGKTTTSTKSNTINPVKAKCEDFLALNDEYQPVAAYWVAGHDKSGKKIKNGEVDEAFLERPVLTLVENCKAAPKASFYSKAKNWISKEL